MLFFYFYVYVMQVTLQSMTLYKQNSNPKLTVKWFYDYVVLWEMNS